MRRPYRRTSASSVRPVRNPFVQLCGHDIFGVAPWGGVWFNPRDMDAPQPKPTSPEEPVQPEQLPPDTALDVRNRYVLRTGIFGALMIWFWYDGWYNPEIKSKTFNKVGAVVLLVGFVFCAIMAGSAALTVLREQKQKDSTPPPPPA